ncbi:hypothetical protein PIB30_070935 [Stylosanthes scabra]|uniref:Retrotransposon gag domain-containing protein n=1 Tax=Stylosanthes scabra TaxID=79078 RepID=A0ABU6TQY1_9FABA|nr:hypothetical protein [Stylosanthes scabra]
MVLLNASDATKCKAFSVTLKKDALTWFNSLAPGSIKNFSDLSGGFQKKLHHSKKIEGLECQATLMALVKGLREDTPFLKSLTKRPPKTIEEIQERSHDYLQQEEGQSAVKTDRDKKEAGRKDLSRENRSKREQRFGRSYYNPLNVSLDTFLHEVSLGPSSKRRIKYSNLCTS